MFQAAGPGPEGRVVHLLCRQSEGTLRDERGQDMSMKAAETLVRTARTSTSFAPLLF